jgi:hypothetical protein
VNNIKSSIVNIKDPLLVLVTIFLVLGQRLAIRVGVGDIFLLFFIVGGCLVYWIINLKVEISKLRLLLYLFLVISLSLPVFFARSLEKSYQSFVFLLAIYFSLIFKYKNVGQISVIYKTYQTVMFGVAIMGIVQFVIQLFGGQYIDPFELIPPAFLAQGYNTVIPLEYGSNIYKSNGVFFLEPSHFSRFVAFSILIEILYFKRLYRVLILITGFLFSFSGTGFIVLGIGLMANGISSMGRLKFSQVFAWIIALSVPTLIFLYSEYGYYTVKRISEINQPNTSGYHRFIAPYQAVWNHLKYGELNDIVFGFGPGLVDDRAVKLVDSGFHASPFVKVFLEYGLIGTIGYTIFILNLFFYKPINIGLLTK